MGINLHSAGEYVFQGLMAILLSLVVILASPVLVVGAIVGGLIYLGEKIYDAIKKSTDSV